MSWKFRDFSHRKGEAGRFEIWSYSNTDTYDVCKVLTYCQTDTGARWAAKVLFEVAIDKLVSPECRFDFNVTSKKYRGAGPKHNAIEVGVIINLSPSAAMAAITKHGGSPPAEDLVIKPGAVSVGPCAWQDEFGTYVKVRFDGHSVPFYYNDKEFLIEATTKAAHKEVGGTFADAIVKVLVDNAKMLHERAVTRPLNLSKIDDYAQHNIKVLKGDGTGRYRPATPAELADPKAEIATVFSYGMEHNFVVIDDDIYKIHAIVSGYKMLQNKGDEEKSLADSLYSISYELNTTSAEKGYLRLQDCQLIDPRDQYVREKIGRSVKAKL